MASSIAQNDEWLRHLGRIGPFPEPIIVKLITIIARRSPRLKYLFKKSNRAELQAQTNLAEAATQLNQQAESLAVLFKAFDLPLALLSKEQLEQLQAGIEQQFIVTDAAGRARRPSAADNTPQALHLCLQQVPQIPLADMLEPSPL